MRRLTVLLALGLIATATACGPNGGQDEAGGDGASAGDSLGGDSQGDGDGDGDGDAGADSQGDGDGDGDGDSQGDGDGDGDSQGDGDGDGDGDDGANIRFDLAPLPDAPPCAGNGNGGEPDYSYLWAANSSQGTISKIDTQTLLEEGRYIVRPDSNGSPSRTSVSLSGHVAVANRSGGVAKVWALPDFCQESNGQPGIQTSEGNQILPWGEEECIAWYTPFNYASQRPVAWAQGEFNQGTCNYENEKLWTSGRTQQQSGQVDVLRLNGDTGEVEDMVVVNGVSTSFYGIYGGAVDGDGNFWGSQLGTGRIVRVDGEDLTYQTWPMAVSGYGMTVDSDGYVWTCSYQLGRFDPETETWQTAQHSGSGGCMADDDYIYQAGSTIKQIDRETLQLVNTFSVQPGGAYGISIDFYGYVWGVSFGSYAHRLDPNDGTYETFTGLTGAYTYSDMTGFALSNAGSAAN